MMGLVRGLLAAATFAAFIALVVRVWNRKFLHEFDAVARLALDEDEPRADGKEPRK